jgi:plastocyanin
MISDDYNTIYHYTVISEYDDNGDISRETYWGVDDDGTLDSNDSRAYFPSNYYDYEDHGDDKDGDGEEMLFRAMIENVTDYQDGDITAEEAANNFIDLMYTADAMGIYDDNGGDDGDCYDDEGNMVDCYNDEGDDGDCPFDSMDFCYESGPYCDPESGNYDPAYCGAESAHYCLEDGANDEGCAEIDDLEAACAAGEAPQEICDAFLNFDHDAYHDGDDEDDHARLDGIIGTENPPNADPVTSSTNIVGAISDNEGLPMMATGSFKLKFEGADASLETHEAYIPIDGNWNVAMILLEGYEVISCEGCEDLVIDGNNAKFNAAEPVTVTFGQRPDCDQTVTVGDDGFSFEPAEITISVGDTVCWLWDTADAHNVVEIAAKFDEDMNLEDAKIGFYSGDSANTVDFRHTFSEDNQTHYYVCEPHATMGMAGTVTVGAGSEGDRIPEVLEDSGLPNVSFMVGALVLVGAASLRRRIH